MQSSSALRPQRIALFCLLSSIAAMLIACAGSGSGGGSAAAPSPPAATRHTDSLSLNAALAQANGWKPVAAGASGGPAAAPSIPAALQSSLRAALGQALRARGQQRFVSSAPSGNGAAVDDFSLQTQGDGSVLFTWGYRNPGDYDQNSEVTIADLTPVGAGFRKNSSDSGWPKYEPADGDGNGEINIADVTPIGLHFLTILDGYALEDSLTPAVESSWQPVAAGSAALESAFADSLLPAGGGRRTFSLSLPSGDPALVDKMNFRVRPFTGSGAAREYGPPSNLAEIGAPVVGAPVWTSTVGILSAVPGDAKVTVGWGEASDPDFPPVHYVVYYSVGAAVNYAIAQTAIVDAPALTTDISGLTDGTEYSFAVRVRDSAAQAHEDNNDVELTATPESPKFPPSAKLDATPASGVSPLTATFDASASFDPDGGAIQRYEWDADGIADNGPLGDGFELDSGSTPTYELMWYSSGQHSVRVRVTDDEGATAITSKSVHVNPGPTWHVSYPFGELNQPEDYYTCGITDVGGVSLVFAALDDGSSGHVNLSCSKASDSECSAWSDPVTVASQAQGFGVVDSGGKPATAYALQVTQHPYEFCRATDQTGTNWQESTVFGDSKTGNWLDSAFLCGNLPCFIGHSDNDVSFCRAKDQIGSAWNAPTIVPGVATQLAGWGGYLCGAEINGVPALADYAGSNEDLLYVRALDSSGTQWANPVTVDFQENVGSRPRLAEVSGNPAIAYYDSTRRELKYTRALDSDGSVWDAPVVLDLDALGVQDLIVVNKRPVIAYTERVTNSLRFAGALDAEGKAWDHWVLVDPDAPMEELTAPVGSFDVRVAGIGDHQQIIYCVSDAVLGRKYKVAVLF